MTADEHADTATPLVAAVLALVVLAAMLLLSGLALAATVHGAAAAQVALLVARGAARRRTGREAGRPDRLAQFAGIWSVQAGLTYVWAGDDSATSAWIYIGVGVVFAAVATWFLARASTLDDEDSDAAATAARPTDTRPLPTAVADDG